MTMISDFCRRTLEFNSSTSDDCILSVFYDNLFLQTWIINHGDDFSSSSNLDGFQSS